MMILLRMLYDLIHFRIPTDINNKPPNKQAGAQTDVGENKPTENQQHKLKDKPTLIRYNTNEPHPSATIQKFLFFVLQDPHLENHYT
jgi:hypothetical protein